MRSKMLCALVIFFVYAATCSKHLKAQSNNDLQRPLEVSATIQTQVQGTFFGRVKCDNAGNLYMRPYSSVRNREHTLHQTPIQRVKPDGSLAEIFNNTDAMPNLEGMDFFISPDGDVFQVAYGEKQKQYVISFAKDGSVKSTIEIADRLIPYFTPYQMAVFKSGEILLSGQGGDGGHTPFTAVFDASGKLIKKVTDEDDAELGKRADAGETGMTPGNSNYGNAAVTFGEAVAGSDGNVYLMRSGSPALILAVSPHGDIVRKFKVNSDDPALIAVSMKAAPGRLAFAFRKQDAVGATIKVTDFEGNAVATYVSNDRRMPAAFLSCYSPPDFTFTQSNTKGFVLVHKAEAK